jgi:hypothetical protein
MVLCNPEEAEMVMSKTFNSAADDLPEGRVSGVDKTLGLNPPGNGRSSAPAGIFSMRRARYFNKAVFDETGHGVRRADIAEAAIAEGTRGLQQAGGIRDHRVRTPRS